ncbi:DegV family protein [Romboutsia sp. 13368]|uniref:DegV family protein n=1 Tax=Romboutsia sp. 13368 TaxID=2708053 RepID=UPI0025EE6672|nr:DegV family protein [Romboutsia sp. 13368]
MIKILCDSIVNLPTEIIEKYNIDIIPLTVIFNENEYLDGVDISNKDFYKILRENETLPKTSQATYAQFIEFFEKYKDDEVLYLSGSSAASGTYQSAVLAKNDMDSKITIFDTFNLSLGSGVLVIKACEMVEKGLSVEEIVENLENLKNNVDVFFSVDTLEYLKRGGRISSTKAALGNLLNIKPILTVNDGLVVQKAQVRGKKQTFSALVNCLTEKYGDDLSDKTIFLGYTDNDEDLETLNKTLLNKTNAKNIYTVNIGCVICSHSGPGVIGISCI